MNTTTQTTDERCHEWARHAFYCATHLAAGYVNDNTAYGMRIRIPALADRIIALRAAELAQGGCAVSAPRTEYKIRNADGSLWAVVMYKDLAEEIIRRGKTDAWLFKTGRLPQTIEAVPAGCIPDAQVQS